MSNHLFGIIVCSDIFVKLDFSFFFSHHVRFVKWNCSRKDINIYAMDWQKEKYIEECFNTLLEIPWQSGKIIFVFFFRFFFVGRFLTINTDGIRRIQIAIQLRSIVPFLLFIVEKEENIWSTLYLHCVYTYIHSHLHLIHIEWWYFSPQNIPKEHILWA